MPKKTGGPAFPGPFTGHCGDEAHSDPCGCYLKEGMALRDYFAIHSLLAAGILSNKKPSDEVTAQELAKNSYKIADAMIAEREKE